MRNRKRREKMMIVAKKMKHTIGMGPIDDKTIK